MTAWAFAQLPAADADDADTRASPGAAAAAALAAAVTCCVERRAEGGGCGGGGAGGTLSPMSLTNLMWAHANLQLPLRPHALRLLVEEVSAQWMDAHWIMMHAEARANEWAWPHPTTSRVEAWHVCGGVGCDKCRRDTSRASSMQRSCALFCGRWPLCSTCRARARSSRSTQPSHG
jgi:hypothetical protein